MESWTLRVNKYSWLVHHERLLRHGNWTFSKSFHNAWNEIRAKRRAQPSTIVQCDSEYTFPTEGNLIFSEQGQLCFEAARTTPLMSDLILVRNMVSGIPSHDREDLVKLLIKLLYDGYNTDDNQVSSLLKKCFVTNIHKIVCTHKEIGCVIKSFMHNLEIFLRWPPR